MMSKGRVAFRHQRGFTLLEVLIAVTVTAIIGIAVSQVLSATLNAKEGVDRVSAAFEGVQRGMLLLERDLFQAVHRPVRDPFGEMLFAMTSRTDDGDIELTRTGWRNPLQRARSKLQRVAWSLEGEELRRYYWTVLDRAQDTEPEDQVIMEGVAALDLRFLDPDGQWHTEWPTNEQLTNTQAGAQEQPLPSAVEVVIEHRRFGRLRRLFDMPDFVPGSVQAGVPGGGGGNEEESGGENPGAGEGAER